MPTVQMPTVQMPTVQMPTVQMPTVQMPTVQMPTVQMPTVQYQYLNTQIWASKTHQRCPSRFGILGSGEKVQRCAERASERAQPRQPENRRVVRVPVLSEKFVQIARISNFPFAANI